TARAGVGGAGGAAVSTVSVRAADADDVLPLASVAVAVSVWLPSPRSVVGVKLQTPLASAVAVPSEVVPSRTVTVLFASAVPVMVGVASLVWLSPCVPVSLAAASVSPVGAAAAVSMVNARDADAVEVLPAASAAVAVSAWLPSPSADAGVKFQAPSAPA